MSLELKILQNMMPEEFDELQGNEKGEILRQKIAERLYYLLLNDFEFLINAMYRMDIDEKKFTLAMKGETPEQISAQLTQLIWDRIQEKIKWRKKYSENKE